MILTIIYFTEYVIIVINIKKVFNFHLKITLIQIIKIAFCWVIFDLFVKSIHLCLYYIGAHKHCTINGSEKYIQRITLNYVNVKEH